MSLGPAQLFGLRHAKKSAVTDFLGFKIWLHFKTCGQLAWLFDDVDN